jgi:hypothetical protein
MKVAQKTEWAAIDKLGRDVEIRNISEARSHEEPLLQVADLFAGAAAYFVQNGSPLTALLAAPEKTQKDCLETRTGPIKSNADRERFSWVRDAIAETASGPVRLRLTARGLDSNPRFSGLDFWTYTPQGTYDKAPSRREAQEKRQELVSFLASCSIVGCSDVVEVTREFPPPLCKTHLTERMERASEREFRREREWERREFGSHYCENCAKPHTPTASELAEAEYLSGQPKCPACGKRRLVRSDGSSAVEPDRDLLLTDFETRQSDRYEK